MRQTDGRRSAAPRVDRNLMLEALAAPWSRPTWLATAHLLTGAPIALAAGFTIVCAAAAAALLAITIVAVPAALLVLLTCSRWFADLQRSRFAAFLDVTIPPMPRTAGRTWLSRVTAEARERTTWRQVGFHLVSAAIEAGGGLAVALSWGAAFTLSLIYPLTLLLKDPLPQHSVRGWDLGSGATLVMMTLIGVTLLYVTPWLVRGITALDLAAAEKLLGPDRAEELSSRVAQLSASRLEVVDAADAERRRIERDLHDGTQQRLVSLAMNLGMARALHPGIPEIAEAHDEAKLALTELRDFVRGLHPAVLNDRGLDAALSGIAARSPVPVRLRVDLPARPPATVEAIAYFVVSEALANVAKHARAGRAEVTVTLDDDGAMHILIGDDGVGGAHPAKGGGLRGLAQRAESVDGTLKIDSPDGGPTLIHVELPCA